jgi:uncharacterized protein DUF559
MRPEKKPGGGWINWTVADHHIFSLSPKAMGRGTTRRVVEGQMRQTSKATVRKARALRRTMTPPEAKLWNILRTRPADLKFRHQHPAGPYVIDFYCPAAKLVPCSEARHRNRRHRARNGRQSGAGRTPRPMVARTRLSHPENSGLGASDECGGCTPAHSQRLRRLAPPPRFTRSPLPIRFADREEEAKPLSSNAAAPAARRSGPRSAPRPCGDCRTRTTKRGRCRRSDPRGRG